MPAPNGVDDVRLNLRDLAGISDAAISDIQMSHWADARDRLEVLFAAGICVPGMVHGYAQCLSALSKEGRTFMTITDERPDCARG